MMKKLHEVCIECGYEPNIVLHYIREEWVIPNNREQQLLDDEDIARIRLIHDLIEEMGVNEESVPIILHLVDQINVLQTHIKIH
jgi:chaperone modulatory protein CbpM